MTDIVTIGDATLYHGDAHEVLRPFYQEQPWVRVDAVITDPPYSERTHRGHDAIEANGNDGADRAALGYAALSPADVTSLATVFCQICSGWIVWMCDHTLVPHIEEGLRRHGRYVFSPLPFFAPGSRVRLTGDGPSSWTVWIMVARTSQQAKWGTLRGGYVAGRGWDDKQRMGGKPTHLMRALVGDYSRPGQLVCDPFMGSGTTGVACAELGRRFIGVEIDKAAFDIACERIDNAYRQQRLFA